jgi:hypothetical protein
MQALGHTLQSKRELHKGKTENSWKQPDVCFTVFFYGVKQYATYILNRVPSNESQNTLSSLDREKS